MEDFTKQELRDQKRYLELLSKSYPTIDRTIGEIVNIEAKLNLPKGTEHFMTDIHGENEAFNHVLQSGSGAVRKKVLEALEKTTTLNDLDNLTMLIQYPKEKLEQEKKEIPKRYLKDWYETTIYRLIKVARECATKYTSAKVHRALPKDFAHIIEELLQVDESRTDKKYYYNAIISSIVDSGRADAFIEQLSELIKRLVIDHLHIVGDVFDRGPAPHLVMEQLMDHHSMDIQWGNHDILWMGAAAGNPASIANAIRIALRYGNMDVLETGYGINLLGLATFAERFYPIESALDFKPKTAGDDWLNDADMVLMAKMHKAITMIQMKLEDQIIENHPEYDMKDRQLLRNIDYEKGTIKIDGKEYELKDSDFPTINPENPSELTEEEQAVVDKLITAFKKSDKLQKHIRFLYNKGSMYLTYNGNLLFHACQLMEPDGTFTEKIINGTPYKGKKLLDKYDQMAREAYFSSDQDGYSPITDFLWFLWCNKDSPLFGKDKMATFENYFIDDKDVRKEHYNAYFNLINSDQGEEVAKKVLEEFGVDPEKGHMIVGHVPVKTIDGESPIRAGGKQLVIDGGFAKAYQGTTGIAGYTLTYNSYGLLLISHKPFESVEVALSEDADFDEKKEVVESTMNRILVRDTDNGKEFQKELEDLHKLLAAYKKGIIKEKSI